MASTTPDDDLEAWRREEAKYRREGEPFTASTDCPDCGVMDVHWLETPRFRPDNPTPIQLMQESIHNMSSIVSYGKTPRLYDPPGATVIRVCKSCGHRWGQS
ncbi:hypothetical protein PBI_SQUIRTY_83 [Mycobacterium phage Squirty]|uniref:Uncharacterized protein n=1 Tax=Mycobacterium phage Squirty TaxID=1527512 RepID=A0A088F7U7_9CAUD|nr:hypothetical protein PBI_SQUIRTY_83 [Mycobacterium phage Squirty]AIM41030.1 hypothetical protein PBI_SQUIRTY_83 [Mycobacterium phage Squirty]